MTNRASGLSSGSANGVGTTIGGVGGAIAAYGPVGMIAVGTAGVVISGIDIINTYNIIKNETGLTTCTVARLILDVTAMVFSGVGIVKGVRAWRASGSPLKWFNDPKSGEIIWPPNRGFLGEPERVSLMPGTRVDRYGFEGGTFVSPEGTPYEMRSLAPGTRTKPYNIYEVIKPVEVMAGKWLRGLVNPD